MNQEVLDKLEILEKQPLNDWEKGFVASLKASQYPDPTTKQEFTLGNIWEKYMNADVSKNAAAKKPNPQCKDPIFLVELAIKNSNAVELLSFKEDLSAALRKVKAEQLAKSEQLQPPAFEDIPF